jgi:hypothetical protein
LIKPPKHFKQGKINRPIEFRKFEQEEKLCPYKTLENYIERTKPLRDKNITKLFISYIS